MAKVINPFFGTQATGSIGGVTVAPFRGGFRMTLKGQPILRFLPGQTDQRALTAYLARSWGALTANQRIAWKSWADDHPRTGSLGESYTMTGMNAYVSLNTIAAKVGGITLLYNDPPTANLQHSVTGFAAATGTIAEGDVDLSWAIAGGGDAGDYVEILLGRPHASPAINDKPKDLKYHSVVAGNVLLETIEDLIVGCYYWVGVRYVGADGQTSPILMAQATPYAGA